MLGVGFVVGFHCLILCFYCGIGILFGWRKKDGNHIFVRKLGLVFSFRCDNSLVVCFGKENVIVGGF